MPERLCACGCGEPIPAKRWHRDDDPYYTPKYVPGHQYRDRAYRQAQTNAASPKICQCGCGGTLPFYRSQLYTPTKYLRGHHPRSHRPPVLVPERPCACGCGGMVAARSIYRLEAKFLRGHNQKLNPNAGNVTVPRPDQIPSGVCECGCGHATPIATTTYAALRWFRGHPKPFVHGHHAHITSHKPKLKPDLALSAAQAAYLAGLIDGEGTIQIRNSGRSVVVSVANTSQILMDWLSATLGGSMHASPAANANCQDKFTWRVGHRRDAQVVLEAVLPYLIIKRALATKALDILHTLPVRAA